MFLRLVQSPGHFPRVAARTGERDNEWRRLEDDASQLFGSTVAKVVGIYLSLKRVA